MFKSNIETMAHLRRYFILRKPIKYFDSWIKNNLSICITV